jgi:hypothetical protein
MTVGVTLPGIFYGGRSLSQQMRLLDLRSVYSHVAKGDDKNDISRAVTGLPAASWRQGRMLSRANLLLAET